MLSDILDSIKLTLHERVTSPLFGAFTIAWLVINYKLLLVILSGLTPTEKFDLLTELGYHYGNPFFWWPLIVFPFISAMLFLLLYPYPARWIFRSWRLHQRLI